VAYTRLFSGQSIDEHAASKNSATIAMAVDIVDVRICCL
jgi:hypothetical protein